MNPRTPSTVAALEVAVENALENVVNPLFTMIDLILEALFGAPAPASRGIGCPDTSEACVSGTLPRPGREERGPARSVMLRTLPSPVVRLVVRGASCAVLAGGALLLGGVSGRVAHAHSPQMDANLSDWCVGAFSNTGEGGGRVEDSGTTLSCGNCSIETDQACVADVDCSVANGGQGGVCVNLSSKQEVVWWDDRTDAAVNDLATIAFTHDADNLYLGLEMWVDMDPVSVGFFEFAIDVTEGGLCRWHDPRGALTAPGICSVSTDRGCTSDADCHFCTISTELFPSTRLRTCGSGCHPDIPEDICQMDQTCVGLGDGGAASSVGLFAGPIDLADYLLVIDLTYWLVSAGDPVLLMQPGTSVDPSSAWDPVFGCDPDFAGDSTVCDFPLIFPPGASEGSRPTLEIAIPWIAFGGSFGPGNDFRFSALVARDAFNLDFAPDGAIEDVFSEPVALDTSTATTGCPGFGIGNTACEIADGSADAFVPREPFLPHEGVPGGEVGLLAVSKNGAPSITLSWTPSCSPADTDYAVYEGEMGAWDSHAPVSGLCSTGGARTATLNSGSGDHYYLVVPTAGGNEGSYGQDSANAERPVGLPACAVQAPGNCTVPDDGTDCAAD